ncbi:hypothetical protein AZKH_0125 [Azoarcus sp. KH32C]|nr:hypothetical protein AZKH_0125 [Azoarcus sp. KH32C]
MEHVVKAFPKRPGPGDNGHGALMRYHDPAECLELLKQLHPLNIEESHRILSEMITGLLQGMPGPEAHFEVLEAARSPIALAQAELSRRYASRPLPPDSAENETLRSVVALWRTLARSYMQIQRAADRDGVLDDQRATLAQRRVFYAGQALLEYFRARRALPGGMWAELHDSYSAADRAGVAGIRVADSLNEIWKAQSPVEAYVAILLVDLANPYGRSERDFAWVCRWAQRFSPYCTLIADAGAEAPKPAAYGLDLAADHGLRPLGVLTQSGSVRRFDGSQLAGQIQVVLKQFKHGVTPVSLGLGADCPVGECSKLLLSLYRPWGLASAGRRFPRRGAQGVAELCSDWASIAFHIQGKPFDQPATYATQRSLRSDITLLTFGEQVEQAAPRWPEEQRRRAAGKLGMFSERWNLADHSVNGFRVQQRPHTQRLEHRQLLGVRPPDGERFLLAQLSWLMFRGDGMMEVGVHVLPGIPEVIAARMHGGLRSNNSEAFEAVFRLPATPALKAPESLVLPHGWFQPQRILDVFADETHRQFRIRELLLRGPDFEQVSYEQI